MGKRFAGAAITLALFLSLIALLKTYDVEMVGLGLFGPENIGFSHINIAFRDMIGQNGLLYDITKITGILAILVALGFGVLGIVQLAKRGSLKRVDREIILLGGLYVLLGAVYVLFEKIVINYRPFLEPGQKFNEPSFPSSHTMLVCVIMGSTIMVAGKYIKNASLRTIVKVICAVIAAVTVIGRLLSGVHWLTDIIGGILISASLLFLFSAFLYPLKNNRRMKDDAKA